MNASGPVFAFDSPAAARARLLQAVSPVGVESCDWAVAAGRVLAMEVRADRDSPACDVSAMDGFALRRRDLEVNRTLPLAGEIMIGLKPPGLPPGQTLRIVTGAPVPAEADIVIRREDTIEHSDRIEFLISVDTCAAGQNIRRQGENIRTGQPVLEHGVVVNGPVMGAAVNFGLAHLTVHRKVRLGILVTGDELHQPGAMVQPWQLRDSNGPALAAMFGPRPWIQLAAVRHVVDEPVSLLDAALGEMLAACDAVILTGGVSMGDHDHVPAAVQRIGAELLFHKLPLRPGMPVLAALSRTGQPIFGLPGNPVSVLVNARLLVLPTLRKLAGFTHADPPPRLVEVENPDDKSIKLWWCRLAQLTGPGTARLLPTRGSGDIPSAAMADGFVETPPGVILTAGEPRFHPMHLWTD